MAIIDFKTIPENYRRYYTYLEPVFADPLIRGYFTLVASILLVAFFLVFALSPTINTILQLRRKIADQKATVSALDTKINNLIAAQENYSRVESAIPTLEAALPIRPTPQTAVSEIVNLSTPSGVLLTGLSFPAINLSGTAVQKEEKSDILPTGLSAIPFSLAVTGSKDALTTYLRKLEQTLRYLRFSSFTFAFSSQEPVVTVNGNGLTYFLGR